MSEALSLVDRIRDVSAEIRAKGATGLCIYGSRARGDHRPESDVDILVDYDPRSGFSIIELAGIKRMLERALGLEVHITTRNSLSPDFRRAIEDEAIRVL